MKVATKYLCDKCGSMERIEDVYALCTTFQRIPNGNLGVRHMCHRCHLDFIEEFESFFTFLNTTINEKEIK